jgi:hypothetical protein
MEISDPLSATTMDNHLWAHRVSRRQLLRGAVGATAGGAVLGSGMLAALPVLADDGGTTVEPVPIPNGDRGTHHFFPGRGKEVSTITDFNGFVGIAQVFGTGAARDGTPLNFSIDDRFLLGEYVGVDGALHRGRFGVF